MLGARDNSGMANRSYLLILVGLLMGAGPSQPPPPTPLESSQEPKHQPTPTQENAAAKDRGTENAPIIVKINPSPNAYPESAEQSAARIEKASQDRWALIFGGIAAVATALLFVATTGLWVFTWKLWRTTKQAVVDGEKAIRAANDAVAAANRHADESAKLVCVTRETAKRQLRAYINLKFVRAKKTPAGCDIIVRLRNYGLTPAYDVSAVGEVKIVGFPIDVAPMTPLKTEEPHSKDTWGPGSFGDSPMSLSRECILAEQDAILIGTKAALVRVILTYRDAFGDRHTTNVRRFSCGRAWKDDPIFAADGQGNDCD
jgi:hypothetical protein